jgi:hypothetical protein
MKEIFTSCRIIIFCNLPPAFGAGRSDGFGPLRPRAAQPQPKKKGKYLAQSPQSMSCATPKGSPSLRDQNYLGPGLWGLCELGVLGASKSYVSDSCGRKQIAASRHGQTHQLGGMNISSQPANNFDYCRAKFGDKE